MNATADITTLLIRAGSGDDHAWAEIVLRYRHAIRRMVALRMDRRLHGRFDPSDVLQESFLEAWERIQEFLNDRDIPFLLWLRSITGQRLLQLHRRHLTQKRAADREISLFSGYAPQASTASLALHLLGRQASPSHAAITAETRLKLQEALSHMDPIDCEIISLRHFEHLNNREAARELGLNESTASSRYLRALKQLKLLLIGLNVDSV